MYSEESISVGSFCRDGDESKSRRSSARSFCNCVRLRYGSLNPRTRVFVAVIGVLVFALVITTSISASSPETTETTTSSTKTDSIHIYEEPESRVVQRGKPSSKYITPPACRHFPSSELFGTPQWDTVGKELTKTIKNVAKANLKGGEWSDHFGFGHKTVLSGDGFRLAVAYEGRAGFDRTFGMHVDVFYWNSTNWELEQTITDVVRGHSHTRAVYYQSLAISSNGERIVFSDGHGISLFDFDKTADETEKKWIQIGPIMDGVSQQELVEGKQRQFGTNIAMNCDGSVLAISGENERYSYTKVFQEETRVLNGEEEVFWAELGEIRGVKFGGSIAMDNQGKHLAIGTVASDSWKGMVQVWDLNPGKWTRLGHPILGEKRLEKWGGSLALSADGKTVVATSKSGSSNKVTAYQFSSGSGLWEQYGQTLHGTDDIHERFGADIALSHDGKILGIGAPGDKKLLQGRVYIYQLDESVKTDLHWTEIGEVVNGVDRDTFGKSVAISATGDYVAGGSPTRKGKAFQKLLGSVHVFQATA